MAFETTRLVVTCDGCKNRLVFPTEAPATLACQRCGCGTGVITSSDGESKGIIKFCCCSCDEEFFLLRGASETLSCPKCGMRVIIPSSEVVFSKAVRDTIDIRGISRQIIKVGDVVPNEKLKIVIPYYDGGDRIDRAVKTWIIPEVVWALTDEGVVPPGWGVCHQFFAQKNAVNQNLHPEKTKPFLNDIMKKLLDMFPDENYYGFFNTDIILPPGVPVGSLLPSKGKNIVFHHRLELVGGTDKTKIREFTRGSQTFCGKDGFIANKKTLKLILDEFPDLVVGAPVWDDGLVMWLWKKIDREKVELQYGKIWHALHHLGWTPYETDAQYNGDSIEKIGIPKQEWFRVDWSDVCNEETVKTKKAKKGPTLGIIQPGRIGDIGLVLPIAKWYYDQGYKVVWPICTEFLDLFEYVSYVEPLDCGTIPNSYRNSVDILSANRVDVFLDLGIGFGRDESDWIDSKLHFNEWKYKEAKVPFEERHNLQITRNFKKEYNLWDWIKDKYNLNGKGYNVIHDTGTKGPYRFDNSGVRVEPFKGFTVFDWIGIIEKAKHLYCVDSCIANLADQLKLCEGRRSVWFWQDIPDKEPRKTLGFPKLSKDWKVVG